MAEFEGEMNVNEETSELEVSGKFKLTDDELNSVVGGVDDPRMQKIQHDILRRLLEVIFAPVSDATKKDEESNCFDV